MIWSIEYAKDESHKESRGYLAFATANTKNPETGENWSETFVRFLTNPIVASLLTTFGFLGILFELQSPGWGIPGSVGLACLILSLGASYIAELATMSDMLFIFAGVVLLLLEDPSYYSVILLQLAEYFYSRILHY